MFCCYLLYMSQPVISRLLSILTHRSRDNKLRYVLICPIHFKWIGITFPTHVTLFQIYSLLLLGMNCQDLINLPCVYSKHFPKCPLRSPPLSNFLCWRRCCGACQVTTLDTCVTETHSTASSVRESALLRAVSKFRSCLAQVLSIVRWVPIKKLWAPFRPCMQKSNQ